MNQSDVLEFLKGECSDDSEEDTYLASSILRIQYCTVIIGRSIPWTVPLIFRGSNTTIFFFVLYRLRTPEKFVKKAIRPTPQFKFFTSYSSCVADTITRSRARKIYPIASRHKSVWQVRVSREDASLFHRCRCRRRPRDQMTVKAYCCRPKWVWVSRPPNVNLRVISSIKTSTYLRRVLIYAFIILMSSYYEP